MMAQASLFARKHPLLAAFEKFDRENPQVWNLFKRFVSELLAAGWTHYSADAVIHRIRWHMNVTTRSDDGFLINDHHTCYYARKWMAEFGSRHPGFFRTRSAKGDGS